MDASAAPTASIRAAVPSSCPSCLSLLPSSPAKGGVAWLGAALCLERLCGGLEEPSDGIRRGRGQWLSTRLRRSLGPCRRECWVPGRLNGALLGAGVVLVEQPDADDLGRSSGRRAAHRGFEAGEAAGSRRGGHYARGDAVAGRCASARPLPARRLEQSLTESAAKNLHHARPSNAWPPRGPRLSLDRSRRRTVCHQGRQCMAD